MNEAGDVQDGTLFPFGIPKSPPEEDFVSSDGSGAGEKYAAFPQLHMGSLFGRIFAQNLQNCSTDVDLRGSLSAAPMAGFVDYLNSKFPNTKMGDTIVSRMHESAQRMRSQLMKEIGWDAPSGYMVWIPEIQWEASGEQELRLEGALHDAPLIGLVRTITQDDKRMDDQALFQFARSVVTDPHFAIDKLDVVRQLFTAEDRALWQIVHDQISKGYDLYYVMERNNNTLGIHDILDFLQKVKPEDFEKSAALRLLRFVGDVYDFYYFDFNRVQDHEFDLDSIDPKYRKSILAAKARSDVVGFHCEDTDEEAKRTLRNFYKLTHGSQWGMRPMLDFSSLERSKELLGEEGFDPAAKVLELIRHGRVQFSVVEVKTRQVAYMVDGDRREDTSFDPDTILPRHVADIGHTTWAMFQWLMAKYTQARGTVRKPVDVTRALEQIKSFNLEEDPAQTFLRLVSVYRDLLSGFLRQDNSFVVAYVDMPFFKGTKIHQKVGDRDVVRIKPEFIVSDRPEDIPPMRDVTAPGGTKERHAVIHRLFKKAIFTATSKVGRKLAINATKVKRERGEQQASVVGDAPEVGGEEDLPFGFDNPIVVDPESLRPRVVRVGHGAAASIKDEVLEKVT